ncbi:alpha/beta hydrolase family protein [Variovorax boronicumulans]|uniref:alpha/beta hydrolase family protein n=1 Tax=Variovorax boronicumulans TaxID=436515 RepID=UPI0033939BD4
MQLLRFAALVALFCLSGMPAHAAGFTFLQVPADADGPALRGAVWYPCDAAAAAAASPAPLALGPLITLQVAKDCPIQSGKWPLIVISHGAGGSFLGHRDTAAALADAGFVVAAISHSGDNFEDMSRHRDLSVFISRPMDMKRLVDYLLRVWPERIAPAQIGFFGFSRGGYTGLVLAGAVPDFRSGLTWCEKNSTVPMCVQARRNELPVAPPVRDERIKAAVIADPLSFFNDAQVLKDVKIPIQLWASERGGDGVMPARVEAVRRGLPSPPDFRVPADSAHFAFLAPCSEAMAKVLPEICNDAGGFDRVAFHEKLNAEAIAFFRQQLR